MIRAVIRPRQLRVLDFDLECRPLSFYGGDFVSKEITAIAATFVGERQMHCWVLGEHELPDMLERFLALYRRADLVTGHYIRGFDLPLLNGALSEWGMRPLPDAWTQDTKLDLVVRHGMSSSQENLAATLRCHHPKVGMNQATWREANRLTPAGLVATKRRVIGDVKQHIEMRARLLALGMLRRPRLWRSANGAAENTAYTP